MPLEAPLAPLAERARALNAEYEVQAAVTTLTRALSDARVGRLALVSSFGAEAVVLLHMVAQIDRTTPVIFLDTEMLFPETLRYQADLAGRLGLRVTRVTPDPTEVFLEDSETDLHKRAPDACCALRKTRPLARALAPFDGWITGRKRYQGARRADLPVVEVESGRIKINPLARWRPEDVTAYIDNNGLPRHPLVRQGFSSIGCAPCTTAVAPGEDPRAGRWRGRDKTECGIHFSSDGTLRPSKEGLQS